MLEQFLDNVIQFVDVGSYVVKRALDEVQAAKKAAQEAQAVRETTLNKLAKAGLVAEHQIKQARKILNSHADSLHLINSLADRIVALRRNQEVQKRAQDVGRADRSQAAWSNAMGRTSALRPSEMILLQVLNGSR